MDALLSLRVAKPEDFKEKINEEIVLRRNFSFFILQKETNKIFGPILLNDKMDMYELKEYLELGILYVADSYMMNFPIYIEKEENIVEELTA